MFRDCTGGYRPPARVLGEYLLELLRDPSWIMRRVYDAELLDLRLCKRRVSVDVDTARLAGLSTPELNGLLKSSDVLPAPITMLRKDLIVSFDLRDAAGTALAVPTREEDVFGALCVLALGAEHALGHEATESILRKLYDLAHSFPDPSSAPEAMPAAWTAPDWWSDDEKQMWAFLVADDTFQPLLRLFTYNFMLLVRARPSDGTLLVKYSFMGMVDFQPTKWQRLALAPENALLEVQLGEERSFHFSISAPPGLEILELTAQPLQPIGPASRPRASRKVWPQIGRLYTSHFQWRQDYAVVIQLQPTLESLLNITLLPSLILVGILTAARVWMRPLMEASTGPTGQADATASLLLVLPSLLTVFVYRQGEHALVRHMLLYLRFLLGVAALLPFWRRVACCCSVQTRPGPCGYSATAMAPPSSSRSCCCWARSYSSTC